MRLKEECLHCTLQESCSPELRPVSPALQKAPDLLHISPKRHNFQSYNKLLSTRLIPDVLLKFGLGYDSPSPSMSESVRRRNTGDSNSDARSVRRRLTQPFGSGELKPQSGLVQDRYGVYNGLTWAKLKSFLEKKFPKSKYPNLSFNETRVRSSSLLLMLSG